MLSLFTHVYYYVAVSPHTTAYVHNDSLGALPLRSGMISSSFPSGPVFGTGLLRCPSIPISSHDRVLKTSFSRSDYHFTTYVQYEACFTFHSSKATWNGRASSPPAKTGKMSSSTWPLGFGWALRSIRVSQGCNMVAPTDAHTYTHQSR